MAQPLRRGLRRAPQKEAERTDPLRESLLPVLRRHCILGEAVVEGILLLGALAGMSRGRPLSPILRDAFAHQKRLREEFASLRLHAYIDAERETNGVLLNPKGRAAGIDPMDLFQSNRSFAYCYASEELVEWWRSHPRMTFPEYERQMYEAEPEPEDEPVYLPEWDEQPF